MTQAKILLTGATGTVGTQLVKKLSEQNIPFKALVRTPDSGDILTSLPNAEIIVGDLADKPSLHRALQGIEKAFLLTNSSDQAEQLQLNFVNIAHEVGVKHIVKLSQFAADESSPVRFLRYHAKVESRIKELGLTYTFLRPNLYMQGLIGLREYIKNKATFFASVGDAAVSAVDVRDIAAVAAKALIESGHENIIYNLTGPEAITHYQMADVFSRMLGRNITFVDVAPERMKVALIAAGFPDWQASGLIEDYAHYSRGEAAQIDNTIRMVTGKEATSFEEFVNNYKFFFQ